MEIVQKQELEDSLQEELAMINRYVAIGLGAFIALAPVAAMAQEQVAQATTDTSTSMAPSTKGHTGSHKGHVRRKGHTAGHRAQGFGSSHAQDEDGSRRPGCGAEELID